MRKFVAYLNIQHKLVLRGRVVSKHKYSTNVFVVLRFFLLYSNSLYIRTNKPYQLFPSSILKIHKEESEYILHHKQDDNWNIQKLDLSNRVSIKVYFCLISLCLISWPMGDNANSARNWSKCYLTAWASNNTGATF